MGFLFQRKNIFNKFTVILIVFIVAITCIMPINLQSIYKLAQIESKLENEKTKYINELAKAKRDKKDLMENIDDFARRKYFMHKDNEDVYIIERK